MLRSIKKIVVIAVLTAMAGAGVGLWLAYADQYTGGAGDGWSSVESAELASDGPVITLSSAADQIFTAENNKESAALMTVTYSTAGAGAGITAASDLRIRVPADFGMRWQGMTSDTSDTSDVNFEIIASDASITSPTYIAGDNTQNYTITFTAGNTIPVDGDIKVTFDSDYSLSGELSVEAGGSHSAGVAMDAGDENSIIITLSAQVTGGENVVMIISGIKNPEVSQTTTDFTIVTRDDSASVLDSNTASGVTITAGALTLPASDAAVTHSAYEAGETPTTTIEFTTANPIEVDGDIQVTFPANYDLTDTLAVDSWTIADGSDLSADGTSVSATNQVLTINIKTAVSAAETVSIDISGIKNPMLLGNTGTYAIETQTAADVQIDAGTAALNTIVIPTITLLTPTAAEISMTVGGSYDITWSNSGTLVTGATTGTSVIPLLDRGIQISYATDGTNYNDTITNRETDDDLYAWTIPAEPYETLKVKLQDTFYQDMWDRNADQLGAGDVTDDTQVIDTANAGAVCLGGASGVGLVGHWKMNSVEGGVTSDESGEGNDGTVSGATLDTTNQKLGDGCLDFDGVDDYVDCGNDASLQITGSFSVSAWFNPTIWNDGVNNQKMIVNKYRYYAEGDKGWYFGRGWNPSNSFSFRIYDGAADRIGDGCAGGSIEALKNTWIHAVGVYSAGSYIKLYINNSEVGSDTTDMMASFVDASTQNVKIGRRCASAEYFTGSIDDVRIYSRALSADEISALYNSGTGTEEPGSYSAAIGSFISQTLDTGGNTALGTIKWDSTVVAEVGDGMAGEIADDSSGLVGLWHMNEVSGYTLQDSSVGGNTLTLGTSAEGDAAEPTYTAYDAGDLKDLGSGYMTFDGTQYAVQKTYATEEGTVKVSTAEGAGFIWDYGENIYTAGQDFSPYAGVGGSSTPYMIVVKDAENDVAWGYLGEEGVGGSEKINNGTFGTGDFTGWVLQDGDKGSLDASSNQADVTVSTGGGDYPRFYQIRTLSLGKGYKASIKAWTEAGQSRIIKFMYQNGSTGGSLGLSESLAITDVPTVFTFCFTTTGTTSPLIMISSGSDESTANWHVDNVSVIEMEGLGSELHTSANAASDPNGNETDEITGWSEGLDTFESSSEVTPNAGTRHFKLAEDIGYGPRAFTPFATTVGKLYKTVAYWQLPSVGGGTGTFQIYDGNPNAAGAVIKSTGDLSTKDDAWHEETIYFTATSTTSYFAFRSGAPGTYYLDNISIREVTTPSPTTGMTVYTTKAGSTKGLNLVTVDDGFNPNDTLTYEVRKSDFQITGALTVGAWVKTDTGGTYVIGKWVDSDEERAYLVYYASSDNTFVMTVRDSSSDVSSAVLSNSYADNAWHFVVGTYTPGENVKIYVDGNLDNTNSSGISASLRDTSNRLAIGSDSNGGKRFTGDIDEPFVFDAALSAVEVLALYRGGVANCLRFQVAGVTDSYETYYGPEDSLVGYWKMNQVAGSRVQDSSGQGNTGTLGGSEAGDAGEPTLDTTNQKLGAGCLSFDGVDDWVDCGNDSSLNPDNAITIVAWVKPITSPSDYAVIFYQHGNSYGTWGIQATSSSWRFFLTRSGESITNFTTGSYSLSEWKFLSMTYDGQTLKGYLNGSESNSSSIQGTINSSSSGIAIGRFSGEGGGNFFNGLIDDVRIYSRALSADEITALYNSGSGTEEVAGRTTTYYTTSGQALPGNLDGEASLKYKAYFSTGNTSYSPVLSDVTLSFAGSTAGDRDIIGVSGENFTISADALESCNVEPETKVAGITEDCVVTFTTVNAIPSTGTIVITFPEGFDIGQTHGSAPTGTGMDGVFAAAVSGQVVTVTRSGGTASAAGIKTLTLTDITNPTVKGLTGTYSIKTTRSDGNTIDEKTDVDADTILAAETAYYAISAPADMAAGTRSAYTLTRYDEFDNENDRAAETVYMYSTSACANAAFFDAAESGNNVNAVGVLFPEGSATANVWYYDELMNADGAVYTITVSDVSGGADGDTGADDAEDEVSVLHAAGDHLVFSADVATPQIAGSGFVLPAIIAKDVFGNTLTDFNDAAPYEGEKTLSYTLSGTPNSPDGNDADSWTTAVTFANGESTSLLEPILYRAQDTTITASATDLPGTDTASNEITVNPEMKVKLVFSTQPSSACIINYPLAIQPTVEIQDIYGNATYDTDDVTLYDSTSNAELAGGTGAITADSNPLAAVNGTAAFTNLEYSLPGVIYLYAQVIDETSYEKYSTSITLSVSETSTVDAADSVVSDFNLVPTNDTEETKFEVLKFKVTDAGVDDTSTLIDKIQIAVGGTAGQAANDILWAGLYIDEGVTQVAVAEGSAITDTYITFGSDADAENDADLYEITDSTATEFTVFVYMSTSKLLSEEGDTYTFDVDESLVTVDAGGLTSMMSADSGAITAVTGTIYVDVSYMEVVTEGGITTLTDAVAGEGENILVRATDANRNVDNGYTGYHALKFYGLSIIGAYKPRIDSTIFGYSKTIEFTAGESSVVVMTAVKAEEDRSVTAVDQAHIEDYGAFELTTTVLAAVDAHSIAYSSGDDQVTAVNAAVVNPIAAIVKDLYGNVRSGAVVTFGVSSTPDGSSGASVSPEEDDTDANGLAEAVFTMGNIAGAYSATASASGLSGTPVTFTATAREPVSLDIVSGDDQITKKITETSAALRVRYLAEGSVGIPNMSIGYAIFTAPDGASGQALSAATATTDAAGYAEVTLTLGDTIGEYIVRASVGAFSRDFNITALPDAPYAVTLAGPSSISTDDVSSVYTVTIRDVYDNASPVDADTVLVLSNAPSSTGTFYADSAGETEVTNSRITISADDADQVFYYKDTVVGTPTIQAAWESGQTGLTTTSASISPVSVIPGDIHHFEVTGTTTAMTAGGSREVTVTAYDEEGNVKTDYAGDIVIVFSGANASPAPTSAAATCSDKDSADIAFGSNTTLTFTSGVAVSTLKVYKAETIALVATAGAVTTSTANDLNITVKHEAADHLKFAGDLPTPQTAGGGGFTFETTLDVVDIYSNICDAAFGAAAYAGSKTVTWTLSGETNGPEGEADIFTNPVVFEAGRSTTSLGATLYRAQATTITPSITGLAGAAENVASNTVTINPGAINKLKFIVQPESARVTSQVLNPQPVVAVTDVYGNTYTSASSNVTLRASTTTGSYTAVSNGSLSANALTIALVNGAAVFGGLTYDYPEAIYLRAEESNYSLTSTYSSLVTFSEADEASVAASGTLTEPATISSLIDTLVTKASMLDFKISDAGTDGLPTKVKKIVINRSASDTTDDWTGYIAGAFITDGTTQIIGDIESNTLSFGSGASVIYTVGNGGNKTFLLSLYLKAPLPAGADGKVFGFSMDADTDITLDAVGSQFVPTSALTSTTTITVVATNLKVTGTAAMAAGETNVITVSAIDRNANIDADFVGDKNLEFSGASISPDGLEEPTCTNYGGAAVDFGDPTPISFAAGVNTSTVTMTLYAAETADIKAAYSTLTTLAAHDLAVTVTGGVAGKLGWATEPETSIVANAPWKGFTIAVTDGYGNATSSTPDVTVAVDGGTAVTGGVVAAASGVATFGNFTVTCPGYPGNVFVTASATVGGTPLSAGRFPAADASPNTITVDERYEVTIDVKDYTSSANIDAATVLVVDSGDANVEYLHEATGIYTCDLLYGDYTLTFTKDRYLEEINEKVAGIVDDGSDGSYDNALTWSIILTSLAEATADYQVRSGFIYNQNTDSLDVRIWLERRGILIVNNAVNKLGVATVEIYGSTSAPPVATLSLTGPDSDDFTTGVFYKTVADVTKAGGELALVGGQVYYAKCFINYGGLTGDSRSYQSGTTFEITISTVVKQIVDELSTVSSNIQSEVSGVQTTITSQAALTQAAVLAGSAITQAAVAAQAATTQAAQVAQTERVLAVTGTTSIPDQITSVKTKIVDEVQPHVTAGILTRSGMVKEGAKIYIQYRATSGLVPIISVYNSKNTAKVSAQKMTELDIGQVGGTSIYTYPVTFSAGWGAGEYTVVCHEATKGTMDSITITVADYDIDDVAGDVTSVLGITAGLGDVDTVVGSLGSKMGLLEAAIAKMGIMRAAAPAIAGVVGAGTPGIVASDVANIHSKLLELGAMIKEVSIVKDLGLEKMYEVSDEKKEDITYIKNKTQELKAMMDLNQKMVDNVANEPVIQTWYEYGSVILRAIIINPSETQIRVVPFKAYLPKEARPEDILIKGDLSIAYDTQQGSYYMFAEYTMKPKETREVAIEIEDIWQIETSDLEAVRAESVKIYNMLEGSEFSDRAKFLLLEIEDQLDRVEARQKDTPINPEVHISQYRENLKLMEEANLSLILMRSLLSQVKPVSVHITWRLIAAIILFLGILSGGFYFAWQRQLRLSDVPTFEPEEDSAPASDADADDESNPRSSS